MKNILLENIRVEKKKKKKNRKQKRKIVEESLIAQVYTSLMYKNAYSQFGKVNMA